MKPKEPASPETNESGQGSVAKAPPPPAPLDDKIATRSPAVPARPAEPASPPAPQVSGRSSDELATIRLFAAASPSVVHITTHTLERDFFSLDVTEIPQGTGSGFVWDAAGHVVTNYHVIEEASGAQVALADHSTWPANLVGVAPDKDLAVLKINAPADRLRPIPVGTSHDLQVGQTSLAIGNPFGLDQTLTTGVISGVLILAVERNSSAAAAGLRATTRDVRGKVTWGDVIVQVDELPIQSADDLLDALERHRVGEEVTLTVLRLFRV